jgi:hypothetical protein
MFRAIRGFYNPEEIYFLFNVLPQAQKKEKWLKHRGVRKLKHSDGFFFKESGMEMVHRIISCETKLNGDPFTIEICLSSKKPIVGDKDASPYKKLHRFFVLVVDRRRITNRKKLLELAITSRQKDCSAYKLVKTVFDKEWETASVCKTNDTASQYEALGIFNRLYTEK